MAAAQTWTIQYDDRIDFNPSSEIKELFRAETDKVQLELKAYLPGLPDDMTLLIIIDTVGMIEETGSVGLSFNPKQINFGVNPYHPRTVENITIDFRSTLYHEAHHVARGWVIQGGKMSTSFMDAVISEGMATCFERDFGGGEPLWAQYPENVEEWVAELRKLTLAAFSEYGKWMFLHPDGRQWIGYRSGTYIVEKAMKNSKKNHSNW